jgi:HEAT repeat protein
MKACGWMLLYLCLACWTGAQPGITPAPPAQESDLGKLTQQLKSDNAQTRLAVVQRLQDLGGPKTLAPLLQALADSDEDVRSAAASTLAWLHTPAARDRLLGLLTTGRPEMRAQVADALAVDLDPRVTDALVLLLQDARADVRARTILALQTRDDPRLPPAFLALTRDPDTRVRDFAVRTLAMNPAPAAEARLLEMLADPEFSVRMSAVRAIQGAMRDRETSALWTSAIPPLIARVGDENPYVRYAAIETLSSLRVAAAVPAIIAALQDKDAMVRQCAIGALGLMRDLRAVPPLLALVQGTDENQSVEARQALQSLGRPALPQILEACRQAKDAKVRDGLLGLLEWQRDPLLTAFFIDLFTQETDPALRARAARGIGRNFTPKAVLALLAGLQDPNPEVRQAAASALSRSTDPGVVDALLPLLCDPAAGVRTAAANTLFQRDDPRVIPALTPLLHDPSIEVRVVAIQCLQAEPSLLETFLEAVRDPNAQVRKAAVGALHMQYGRARREERPRILEGILSSLQEEDANTRQELMYSLGWYGEPVVITALIDTLQHDPSAEVREFAARALGSIGDDRAVEPLMEAIRDQVEWARSAAKDELGDIGDLRAVPALLAIKDDGDQQDRWRTAGALARLGVANDALVPKGFTAKEWAILAPACGREELGLDALRALQAQQPALVPTLEACLARMTYMDGLEQRMINILVTLKAPGAGDAIAAHLQRLPDREQAWFSERALLDLHDPRAIEPTCARVRRILREGRQGYDVAGQVEALGAYDDPRVIALCKELCQHPDTDVRFAALGVLTRNGDAGALAQLQQTLAGDDMGMCLRAIAALGQSGHLQALEPLLAQLASPDMQRRYAAAYALKKWLTVNPDAAAYERVAPGLLAAVGRMKENGERLQFIEPLATRTDPRALDLIIAEMRTPGNGSEEGQALELLAPYRGEKVVACLLQAMDGPFARNRARTADLLGANGDPQAVPVLLQAMRTDTTRVRLQAIHSLGVLQATTAIDPLIAALSEPGTRVKAAAAQALTAITGQRFGEDAVKWRAWWKGQGKTKR